MTVISAGIVNKQGKIILSRQFTDVSRIRIEGLLSAFPKLLVGNNGSTTKQCTYVEAGAVRYVYQPVENLLLVLVTTKNSNIVEDLATLRLMGQIIPEYVNNVDEETVANKAFELLFAFDEVIVSGKREHNTLEQIMTYLEMQSHEEEVAKEEKKLQMELAKKEASRRAREITQKRRENGYGGIGSHTGSGRGGSHGSGHYDANDGDNFTSTGNHSAQDDGASRHFASVVEDAPKQAPKPKSVGGMSLGRARKADITSKVLSETGGGAAVAAAATSAAVTSAAADSGSSADGIFLRFEETISCTLNRDGGATGVDVSGNLFVTVTDAQLANVRLLLGRINDDFGFRTHPNINKNLFTSDRVLTIKDNKPFPTHQALGILKWRLQNPGRVRAPLTVTCWPGTDSATVEFELENLQATLLDVTIVIPLGGVRPAGAEASYGSTSTDGDNLQWTIPVVDSSHSSGSCEISLSGDASDESFFPIQIFFQAKANIAGVTVTEAVGTETGMPVRFSSEVTLTAENYTVS